jgi:NodT family efflux transporter outer membrane factor (OMF) lipoprotein
MTKSALSRNIWAGVNLVKRSLFLLPAVLVGLAGGCNVGPNFQKPNPKVQGNWAELKNPTTTQPSPSVVTDRSVQIVQWWATFHDPGLDSLINKAERQNLDLMQAESRIRAARAERGVAGAAQLPTLVAEGGYADARGSNNVSFPISAFLPSGGKSSPSASHGALHPGQRIRPAQASNNGGSANNAGSSGGAVIVGGGGTGLGPNAGGGAPGSATSGGNGASAVNIPSGGPKSPLGGGGLPGINTQLYEAGFDASYELDIFGGTRRGVEEANANYQAALEDERDVLVTLLAEVARDYIELRGFQRELYIAKENLAAQQHTLDLTRQRFAAGLTTQLDVAQAEAQVATTSSQIPIFESDARQSIHRISELLGEEPFGMEKELASAKPIPPIPPEIPIGMPSDLLLRRPDIREAEQRIAAATARVGVATADLFPKFTITGSFGLDSSKITHLVDWPSRYFLVSPGVSWPIFEGGQIRANIQFQKEGEFQAMINYRQTVLAAFREVEDALSAYDSDQARRAAITDAVNANQQAVNLSNQQYSQGVIDFLTVLDTERALFETQDELAQIDASLDADLIALYKALGGGWQVRASDR